MYPPEIHPQYSEAMTDAEFLRWLHLRLTRDFGDMSGFQHVSRVLTLSDRLADEERAAGDVARERAAVTARVSAGLADLSGSPIGMSALAECIVSGGLRGVTVDWEVA